MGLNKPMISGGGLTSAEVQAIIDAQTNAIKAKVDSQTNVITSKVEDQTATLKTDIPNSVSGGASVDDIKSALDEKLPQYTSGAVVKSKQTFVIQTPYPKQGSAFQQYLTQYISKVNPSKTIALCQYNITPCYQYKGTLDNITGYETPVAWTYGSVPISELTETYFKLRLKSDDAYRITCGAGTVYITILEFH